LIFSKQVSRSVINFLLSAGLVCGVVTTPVRLVAQDAAPQTTTVPTRPVEGEGSTVDRKTKRDKEEAAEKEETNSYRHSATVQWLGKTFGWDDETAARVFEFINFGVIVLAVGIPLLRAIPKLLRKRSSKLSAEIEVAQAKTADANERLTVVEKKLAGLDSEIAAIRKQVEEDMKGDEVRAKAAMEEESARIVAAAEQEIVMAGIQAERSLKQFAADLAIERALSHLSLSAEEDRALISQFGTDMAGSGRKSSKGGQN
jgi:F-type H+-transporting ATPase subunit b